MRKQKVVFDRSAQVQLLPNLFSNIFTSTHFHFQESSNASS
jgi:hypothetical protein